MKTTTKAALPSTQLKIELYKSLLAAKTSVWCRASECDGFIQLQMCDCIPAVGRAITRRGFSILL
jgi:hypothetical protein